MAYLSGSTSRGPIYKGSHLAALQFMESHLVSPYSLVPHLVGLFFMVHLMSHFYGLTSGDLMIVFLCDHVLAIYLKIFCGFEPYINFIFTLTHQMTVYSCSFGSYAI